MEPAELQQRIASFPRWHYRFEFDGGIETPVAYIGQINRHEQRRRYFFTPCSSSRAGRSRACAYSTSAPTPGCGR